MLGVPWGLGDHTLECLDYEGKGFTVLNPRARKRLA